jgi:hypothetical protein
VLLGFGLTAACVLTKNGQNLNANVQQIERLNVPEIARQHSEALKKQARDHIIYLSM